MIEPLQYIRQHMEQRDIRIALQQFLFVPFHASVLRYEVNGCNQHLFAELAKIPIGTVIIADNNAIEIKAKHKETSAWEEFSGQITIEIPEEQEGGIEFIQIITHNGSTQTKNISGGRQL